MEKEKKIVYCMPDEVETKEQHEKYLKVIGHEKWLQEQQK